jgi:hypothetical protein
MGGPSRAPASPGRPAGAEAEEGATEAHTTAALAGGRGGDHGRALRAVRGAEDVITSKRPLPDWAYAVPDERNVRIHELEAALLDMNDIAAVRSDFIKILTLQIEILVTRNGL